MRTYQDWLEVAERDDQERMDFIRVAINDHKADRPYRRAVIGEDYYAGNNTTIKKYEKLIYNIHGEAVPDYTAANHKLCNLFFFRAVTQANSTLLGNGVKFTDEKTKDKLGKDFDRRIMDAGRAAMVEGACFGFFNKDHVEIFELREFVPFFDEEDGALKAGIRFWQIDDTKPLRATMYELDGYTEYIWDGEDAQGRVFKAKRAYLLEKRVSEADGEEIYDFKNYPTFPVVPCYSNSLRESELVPIRATIDAMDLIQSGYVDDVDNSVLFWSLSNAGGMDDADLMAVLDKLKKLHISQVDDGAQLQPHVVEPAVGGREAILERLERQLYKDAMALNTYDLASGAVTATQIVAAYEPLNEKLDLFETQITEFISRILAVAGLDDEPTYDRSMLINKSEEISLVLNSANFLEPEYITEKILTLMGDKDRVEEVQQKIQALQLQRMAMMGAGAGETGAEGEGGTPTEE